MANITHNSRRATPTIAFFFEPVFRNRFSYTARQRGEVFASRQAA